MAFGIYKPGQGYWVRVCSAVFWGTLALAVAAYGWNQASTIDPPTASWTYRALEVTGEAAPESVVTLERRDADGALEAYATATLKSVNIAETGTPRVEIAKITPIAGVPESGAPLAGEAVTALVPAVGGGTQGFSTRFDEQVAPDANPLFPPIYLRAGIASAIILLGSVALFMFIGINRKTSEFLIATDGEMKKVNWSTPREIRGSTVVVIVASFLIAGILFVIDQAFAWAFSAIDLLQT